MKTDESILRSSTPTVKRKHRLNSEADVDVDPDGEEFTLQAESATKT